MVEMCAVWPTRNCLVLLPKFQTTRKRNSLSQLDFGTHMAQTTTISFFSNLFANKNEDMVSYQEALDCPPWSTWPFPPNNLVVMSNIKALYMFIIYIHTYVVCNILKWLVELWTFWGKKCLMWFWTYQNYYLRLLISGVTLLHYLWLMFNSFQIMGITPFFHRLFWVWKEFTHAGPLAYNRPFSWDHVLTTWCTHSIRKPLGS